MKVQKSLLIFVFYLTLILELIYVRLFHLFPAMFLNINNFLAETLHMETYFIRNLLILLMIGALLGKQFLEEIKLRHRSCYIFFLTFVIFMGILTFSLLRLSYTRENHLAYLPFLITILVFAPINEEIIFRYCMILTKNKKLKWLTSILSSFLFVVSHVGVDFQGLFMLAILATLTAIAYVKTQNIIYPTLVHFLWNVVMTIVFLVVI